MLKNWICCQIGAREHYAVPRVLHRNGQLAALYTDFWADSTVRFLAAKTNSKALNSLAARYHPDLADAPVHSWNWRSLMSEAVLRRKQKSEKGKSSASYESYHDFVEVGHRFAVAVRAALKRRSDLGTDSIFFAYDTGALEALEWCQERKIKCVLNQMDPSRVEVELVREEEKLWPGWQVQPLTVPEPYFQRREKEWALADRILVNSEFCRAALVEQGVPAKKLVVVPLCYEANDKNRKSEIGNRKSGQPLRVLFLGQVILRKGIQYFIEAAKLLSNENIRFDVVGPVGISAAAVATAPPNMKFHGRAARNQARDWYRQADVFVLPTLSDGFALTQLEAMAYGLPVVATACCGDVVSDGVDGFIVPPRDANTLARTLQRYLTEPALLKEQHSAALVKAGQFTSARLADNLLKLSAVLNGD